jgi:formate dehydrogenase maturation protein FdhE
MLKPTNKVSARLMSELPGCNASERRASLVKTIEFLECAPRHILCPADLSTVLRISDDDIKNHFRQLSKTGSLKLGVSMNGSRSSVTARLLPLRIEFCPRCNSEHILFVIYDSEKRKTESGIRWRRCASCRCSGSQTGCTAAVSKTRRVRSQSHKERVE